MQTRAKWADYTLMVRKEDIVAHTSSSICGNPRTYRYALLLCSLIFPAQFIVFDSHAANLTELRGLQDRRVQLSGEFGPACSSCEVRVEYSDGLTYAYQPLHWDNDSIQFIIEDLGQQPDVRIYVLSADGPSNARPFTIQPNLQPGPLHNTTQSLADNEHRNAFTYHYDNPYGGMGKDRLNVSSKPAACGQKEKRFHRVELVIGKQRFGDARITRKPETGCQNCSPIEVEWYHEPTGEIEYRLRLQYRLVEGICRDRIRR